MEIMAYLWWILVALGYAWFTLLGHELSHAVCGSCERLKP
jgi:hypothetical protein